MLDQRRVGRSPLAVASGLVLAVIAVSLPGVSSSLNAAPGDGSATVLEDSFTRADSWQLGVTESGQPWQTWSGTAVVSGASAAASVSGYTAVVADAETSSGSVALSVPAISEEFWMIFRGSDPGNYWRFGRWQGGSYQLQQIAGWALGNPAITTLGSVSPAAGDRVECRFLTGVTCAVNGVDVASSADSFNSSASHVGFAAYAGGAAPAVRFDDVVAATPLPAADLVVDVVAGASSVEAGEAMSWTATVTNVGDQSADDVSLSAALPVGLTSVGVVTSAGSCVVSAEAVCDVGTLASGGSVSVVVSGVAPSTPQAVTLSVSVESVSDANSLNNEASALVTVRLPVPSNAVVVDFFDRPDSWTMGVAETGQPWQVWQGTARVAGSQALASESGYTMSVIDTGTPSGSVAASVPVVSSDFWLISRASNTGNYWRFGSTAGGDYELQQIRNWALASPEVMVFGSVSPAAGDRVECRFLTGVTCAVNGVDVASSADSFNSSASHVGFAAYAGGAAPAVRFDDVVAATPLPAADLVVDVVAGASSVEAGEAMSWTATVTNVGDQSADDVSLSAALPVGLESLVSTGPNGPCPVVAGTHTCSLGSLNSGGAVAVEFSSVAPTSIGAYSLMATSGPIETDGDRSNNQDAASISVRVLAVPGEFVFDSFDRADAAVLGSEAGGRPWEMLQGRFGVVANQAAKTDNTSALSMAVIDPGFTFGTMQVRVAAGADDEFYVLFRAKGTGDTYMLGPDASGNYRVHKMINGRIVGLQFNAIRANVQATDGDVIRLVTRPDDGWFVAINGVHVLDGGDIELLGQFRFGVATRSADVRFDDLSIRQTISTGMTTTETFQHPDGTRLELKTPTSGTVYTWLTPEGYWHTVAGKGVLDSPGFGMATLQTGSELATVRATAGAANPEAWLMFRLEENGAHYRFGREQGKRYTIERIGTTGAQVSVPGGVVAVRAVRSQVNDKLEVRQAPDGTITGYVNGVLVARAVDPSNGVQASAYGIAGTKGTSFDDLVIIAP